MNKKKIGIIGGVGPQATQVIYEKIMSLAQSKYGAKNNDDYPHVLIESVPVPDFISDKSKMVEAQKMLEESALRLTNAGSTVLCIGSNTVHLLLENLKKQTPVPFLCMPELVAEQCSKLGYKKVGLVGSSVTLTSGLYENYLEKHNINVIIPSSGEMGVIDKIIRHVLAGRSNGNDKQAYVEVLSGLTGKGANGIILGCTELPLAINYEAMGNKIINSMDLLAEALVDYYYKS